MLRSIRLKIWQKYKNVINKDYTKKKLIKNRALCYSLKLENLCASGLNSFQVN